MTFKEKYQNALKKDIQAQNDDDTHKQTPQWKAYKKQTSLAVDQARFDLAQAQLGYSKADIKSANQKQQDKMLTKTLRRCGKIETKEVPKYYQSYADRAKERHSKGLYTKSDLELIKEDIALHSFDDDFDYKWDNAVTRMKDRTEKDF